MPVRATDRSESDRGRRYWAGTRPYGSYAPFGAPNQVVRDVTQLCNAWAQAGSQGFVGTVQVLGNLASSLSNMFMGGFSYPSPPPSTASRADYADYFEENDHPTNYGGYGSYGYTPLYRVSSALRDASRDAADVMADSAASFTRNYQVNYDPFESYDEELAARSRSERASAAADHAEKVAQHAIKRAEELRSRAAKEARAEADVAAKNAEVAQERAETLGADVQMAGEPQKTRRGSHEAQR
jgi:hypothetical protein